MTMKSFSRLVPPPFLLLIALGCTSGPPPEKLVPVTGKVTVKGTPLAKGNIQFVPDKTKGNTKLIQPAGAIKDGAFTLETIERSDKPPRPGAPEGAYVVIVTSLDIADSTKAPKSFINPKYGSEKGGLRAEVKADGKSLDFDLDP